MFYFCSLHLRVYFLFLNWKHVFSRLTYVNTYNQCYRLLGLLLYLLQSLHLLLVSPPESYPPSPAVGVVQLLCRHPRFGPAVRRDGDAVFPAWIHRCICKHDLWVHLICSADRSCRCIRTLIIHSSVEIFTPLHFLPHPTGRTVHLVFWHRFLSILETHTPLSFYINLSLFASLCHDCGKS